MVAAAGDHFILSHVASQPIHVLFDAGCLVDDAGLLQVRALERSLGILDDLAALTARLKILHDYLVDLFIRTRTTPPTEIILDLDPTDDPVHGQQALSGYHGYYRQHQYLPLLAFEGHTGFPLAAWLRPGTV